MTIPKQWLERPISPTCYFCDRPTAFAGMGKSADDPPRPDRWMSFCLNHNMPTSTPIAKLITAGCRFEGVEAWVR